MPSAVSVVSVYTTCLLAPDSNKKRQVFRPREKERYKLRKHRKNDLDSFRKLQQVKKDFEKVRTPDPLPPPPPLSSALSFPSPYSSSTIFLCFF